MEKPLYKAPFLETPSAMVEPILDLVALKPGEVFCDLGFGDGRMLFAAAKRGALALGIEIRPVLFEGTRKIALDQGWGLGERISLELGDLYSSSSGSSLIGRADVVYAFLDEEGCRLLKPRLEASLKPGARVATLSYKIPGWKPLRAVRLRDPESNVVPVRSLYLYVYGKHLSSQALSTLLTTPATPSMPGALRGFNKALEIPSIFGLSLALFGAIFCLGAYTILGNIPLTAMGIGLTVLGIAWAITPVHPIPRETVSNIVKSSCSNIEALLEATGATEKAIYIPLKADGRVVAYVPLKKASEVPLTLQEIAENAGKMLIRLGGCLGIILTPPRVYVTNPSPMEELGSDLNALLDYAIVDTGIAESFSAVKEGNTIVIEVFNPRISVNYPRFGMVMGSLSSCIAAQSVATALTKPVRIEGETHTGNRIRIRLRILEWTDRSFT